MTACGRPNLTCQAVRTLNMCCNAKNVKLDIFHEPVHGHEQVRNFIKQQNINFKHIKLHVNAYRFGHTRNSYMSLSYGFESNDYVVLIEDDQIFAVDFIQMHEYFRDKYRDDKYIFSASAGHYAYNKEYHMPRVNFWYTKHRFFHNQGWGTWRDRWKEMRVNWERFEIIDAHGNPHINYEHDGWDWKMQNVVMKNRASVVPFLSRVHNLGLVGVHCQPYEWEKQIKLSSWAGDRISTCDHEYTFKDVYNDIDPAVKYFTKGPAISPEEA